MAHFQFSVYYIGRSSGGIATQTAAQLASDVITDRRLQERFDYTDRRPPVHRQLVVPTGSPPWASLRQELWNGAEAAETRVNAIVAREVYVSLPHELSKTERRDLTMTLAREIVAKHQVGVDVAIRGPGSHQDARYHTATLLMTTRRLSAEGFTDKAREWQDLNSGVIPHWRARWAELQNEVLARAGIAARVDHRRAAEQTLRVSAAPLTHRSPRIEAANLKSAPEWTLE